MVLSYYNNNSSLIILYLVSTSNDQNVYFLYLFYIVHILRYFATFAVDFFEEIVPTSQFIIHIYYHITRVR